MASFLAFLGVSTMVIVTPGPDTAVTVSGALSAGRRGGVLAALGVSSGQTIWTLLTSVGLGALLVASEPAFLAVKYAGVAYLVFLGAQLICSALSRRSGRSEPQQRHSTKASACFRRGLLSDLSNPKMAVFFTSLLPQFSTEFLGLVLLGVVFALMTFVWLSLYAFAIAKMGSLLLRPPIRRILDAITGGILIALGIRAATESR
ncbi:MAG: LysE family translocator [Nocardioidaceae bacterium]